MAPSSRMAEYRRQVQARYAPVVATVTTPEADAACARCGVRSFADLLRPFADVRGLNVPMRHNAEAPPYALSELSIRFHGVRELCRVAPEAARSQYTLSSNDHPVHLQSKARSRPAGTPGE